MRGSISSRTPPVITLSLFSQPTRDPLPTHSHERNLSDRTFRLLFDPVFAEERRGEVVVTPIIFKPRGPPRASLYFLAQLTAWAARNDALVDVNCKTVRVEFEVRRLLA